MREIEQDVKQFVFNDSTPLEDTIQDNLISLSVSDSKERILAYMNVYSDEPVLDVPEALNFVIRDVAIKRFNKINSEGLVKHDLTGESLTWETGYLDEYEDLLQSYATKGNAKPLSGLKPLNSSKARFM